MFWGFLILLMGLLMLAERPGFIYGDFWEYFWPAAIIAMGASMIFGHRKRKPPR